VTHVPFVIPVSPLSVAKKRCKPEGSRFPSGIYFSEKKMKVGESLQKGSKERYEN